MKNTEKSQSNSEIREIVIINVFECVIIAKQYEENTICVSILLSRNLPW